MPDRVREAIFSMLGTHYDTPGTLPPLHVADVFAGSGSMGLEALSRGAKTCIFFERDRRALVALRSNIESLAAVERAPVVTRDAWTAACLPRPQEPFALVLLDPPYADSEDATWDGTVCGFLKTLFPLVEDSALVVFHHHAKVRYADDPRILWRVRDQRTYGSSTITIWTR